MIAHEIYRADDIDLASGVAKKLESYEKAGFGEEEALTQARVARICRAEDYDLETKKVILWEPYGKARN